MMAARAVDWAREPLAGLELRWNPDQPRGSDGKFGEGGGGSGKPSGGSSAKPGPLKERLVPKKTPVSGHPSAQAAAIHAEVIRLAEAHAENVDRKQQAVEKITQKFAPIFAERDRIASLSSEAMAKEGMTAESRDQKLKELKALADENRKKADKARSAFFDSLGKSNDAAFAAITHERPAAIETRGDHQLANYSASVAVGVRKLSEMLGAGHPYEAASKDVSLRDIGAGGRACFSSNGTGGGGIVNLSPTDGPPTVVHEYGHSLEYSDPHMLVASVAFRDKRTAGSPLVKMSELNPGGKYEDHEVARDDRFFNKYIGKEYRDAQGRDYATEVMSMGIERLATAPADFALSDPEYFKFTVQQLRAGHGIK